ncbi:Uncharacterized protein dnm_002870 [Desulfonema magnum]|uniref:Uncharacterized protein n=1 Tax=Desulfonema magnum TaxID=45655 RepID=A0A975BFD0_9BACT|nr:Uncharacterized protein dnm_002870 [Desulfonema magnum]
MYIYSIIKICPERAGLHFVSVAYFSISGESIEIRQNTAPSGSFNEIISDLTKAL